MDRTLAHKLKAYYINYIFMRTSNDKNHHPRSSSSSDSSDEPNNQLEKYHHSHPQMRVTRQEQPIQSDSKSLSEEDSSLDSPRRLAKRYGLAEGAERAEESGENSDKSIDQIEERIKKLQKDLEERIGKHKQQKVKQTKDTGKVGQVKNTTSPRLPKRPDTAAASHRKPEEKPIANYQSQPKSKPINEPQGSKSSTRIKMLQDKIKVQQPKKEKSQKNQDQIKVSTTKVNQKARVDSKNSKYNLIHGYQAQQLAKANKQIEELHRTIDELKNENRRLKDQIHHRKHKKGLCQVDKLRQLECEGDAKLQKQLELLKIIEGLQGKLKKSISRKLNKGKGTNTSSALLHKGLPAGLLS